MHPWGMIVGQEPQHQATKTNMGIYNEGGRPKSVGTN